MESWQYELVLDVLTDRVEEDPAIVTVAGDRVTVRWIPVDCPFVVEPDFARPPGEHLRVVVSYEASGSCPAVPVESVLRFQTAQPLPGDASSIDVEIVVQE